MSGFKILDNINEAQYLLTTHEEQEDAELTYLMRMDRFTDYSREVFLNELKKHSHIKKQAGYSKSRGCDYISLVLVAITSGDGEFTGHHIKSTCLINEFNRISDSNHNNDEHGEVGYVHIAAYHQLPDGKIVEYIFEKSYEEELENIYNSITKIRRYYDLCAELPEKEVTQKVKRVKI
jgi:hypothetical protein